MAEYIEREALLHDVEQSVVYTAREKITSAEMRGAHKVIERIKCAPAVEPIYIHEPTKSEFKRMAAQMDYVPVVRCEGCVFSQLDGWVCGGTALMPQHRTFPNSFCSFGERKDGGADNAKSV